MATGSKTSAPFLLSNLPMRTITGPGRVRVNFDADVRVVEFLLPFPMHILDTGGWEPVNTPFNGRTISFEKPFVSKKGFEPDGRLGNESLDVYCTVLRVSCKFDPGLPYPEPTELWPLVNTLVAWIRVKARHYWLLSGQNGFGSVYRGSVLTQRGNQIQMSNFGTYIPVVIVRPLSRLVWLSIANELSGGKSVPPSEALFCDALASAAAADDIKAILQLGVAAEIAITELLIDVADISPTTKNKRKFAANGERDSFYNKLEEWPTKLGLPSAKSFHPKGTMKDWVDVVKELYRYRGSVAHSGRVQPGAAKKDIASYAFATNDLLRYCRHEKERLGLETYSYPPGESPFSQLDSFTGVVLDSVAPPSVSIV